MKMVEIGDTVDFLFLEDDPDREDYGQPIRGHGTVVDKRNILNASLGGTQFVLVDDGKTVWLLDPVEII